MSDAQETWDTHQHTGLLTGQPQSSASLGFPGEDARGCARAPVVGKRLDKFLVSGTSRLRVPF